MRSLKNSFFWLLEDSKRSEIWRTTVINFEATSQNREYGKSKTFKNNEKIKMTKIYKNRNKKKVVICERCEKERKVAEKKGKKSDLLREKFQECSSKGEIRETKKNLFETLYIS